MKALRIILYALILIALFFVPLQRVEIANLEPIQGIWMYGNNETVFLETDTEDKGSGNTVEEALADMKENSPGIIYLDTAQYLFVDEGAQQYISALSPYVKGGVRLCLWNGQGGITEAIKYVDAHKIGCKIKDWVPSSKMTELPPLN